MIIINNKKFAETEKEFVDSVFTNQTCVGYAKRYKKIINVMDHQKNRIAQLNRWGVLCKATAIEDGKFWYNFGTIDIIGEFNDMQRYVEKIRIRKELNKKNEWENIYK